MTDPFKNCIDILNPFPYVDFNEANKAHAIAYGALTIALLDKGVLSREEYDRALAQATVIVDQEFARKRDETQKPTGNSE